jgi:peptide deformylase
MYSKQSMTEGIILPLILEPDPLLHQVSDPVININDEVKELARNLIATMQYHDGLGLAAVQVGVLKNIIALNIINEVLEGDKFLNLDEGPMILINPEIIEHSKDKKTYVESCLSFGKIYHKIERPSGIKVKYLDLDGKENFLEISDNIISACLQHEIDHTNGKVFLDRLSKMKRDFMMKKYLKWRKFRDM